MTLPSYITEQTYIQLTGKYQDIELMVGLRVF